MYRVSIADHPLADPARAFLGAAWPVLESQRVVPPPVFHPYVEAGRDYFGPDLTALQEFTALEEAIKNANPRFHDDVPFGERDYPSAYIFSFLEAFIWRLALSDREFSAIGPAADQSLRDLTTAINASTQEVACCRVVSHLSTVDGKALELAGVTVVPLHGERREVRDVIESVIPGSTSSYSRVPPFVFAPPESVVVAQGSSATESSHEPRGYYRGRFDFVNNISGRIERFLLLARLLHAGTSASVYEVQGETCPVRRFNPTVVRFRGAGPTPPSSTHMLRRSIRLAPQDDRRIDGLWQLVVSAERERAGMVITSFAMATEKYHSHAWYEQLVDLATAFEAALSGKDKTGSPVELVGR